MSNPFAVGCAALVLSGVGKRISRDLLVKEFSKYSKSLKDPRYSGKRKYEGYGIIHPINPHPLLNK